MFSTQSSLFQIREVLAFGLIGALLMYLQFSVAPILLGFVLGPMVEEGDARPRKAMVFRGFALVGASETSAARDVSGQGYALLSGEGSVCRRTVPLAARLSFGLQPNCV
ncbi:hypothetical protein LMG31506_01405 [Cupriavidus yeoncheonensis]|uniref:Uncharacterized protein n=1 Tax=Cupriavidus yeoncheonensis TaxID=1462994 RepID=A0A916MWS8_9BURK|nr:hypothetical protein LMG31506_01405 [Cupriavidus yeoncheonensis]